MSRNIDHNFEIRNFHPLLECRFIILKYGNENFLSSARN